MDKIKSAYEKALERVRAMNLDQVDLSGMEFEPKGSQAAARFLREKNFDLLGELNRYPEDVRGYVRKGMEETLLQNIQLPADENTYETNRRAMEGLLALKKNKSALKQVFSELEYLFNYYTRAFEHTYANLKESFAARLEQAQEALQRQLGVKVRVDVERHPAFLEEWLRVQGELNGQYETILAEQKEKIRSIP
ncbi:hypothetical protein EDD75_0733 [Thermodesulfitimonas autotrophica]|uniref:Uncharacterized protein n=1 Tax=Thermodesulfitimonas autotrophica TaxID=1894989 RepID=A0A3N5AY67_9THEO|nr:DUF6657 family protein [Thermodesulfitimonas autotrophica]RPF49907.1 hypothetical protein EDD75_0733 [Thermodesulfitimonas autotrophica]